MSIVYICVPTPSNEDGSCNTDIVEEVIADLYKLYAPLCKRLPIFAIKSTVEPGFTSKMIDKYYLYNLAFVPEFLRERAAFEDFINMDVLAVGSTDPYVFEQIVKCHGKYPKSIVQLTPTEAELLKYFSNIYNASKVVLANEFFELAQSLGANYEIIKNALVKRDTIIDTYLDVNDNFRGYAGPCLKKDCQAIIALVNKMGLNLKIFEAIDTENNKFKKTVFPGMRE
jgi:UDPglucose 6-dehydrogenase